MRDEGRSNHRGDKGRDGGRFDGEDRSHDADRFDGRERPHDADRFDGRDRSHDDGRRFGGWEHSHGGGRFDGQDRAHDPGRFDGKRERYDKVWRYVNDDRFNDDGYSYPSRKMNRRPGYQPVPNLHSTSAAAGEAERTDASDQLFSFSGILELHPKGFGFLRIPNVNCVRLLSDPFVPKDMVKTYNLREGVLIHAAVHPNYEGHGPRLMEIFDVEGLPPDDYAQTKLFDQMPQVYSKDWLRLETGSEPISTRVMDILTPLGKGHRALIVAPRRTGKTVLLQQICSAISVNYPKTHIIGFFLDERPEDVNDFRLAVKAEIITGKRSELENQIRLSQLVMKRCRRLVEVKKDVLLLIDSMTSMTRAVHHWVNDGGQKKACHLHLNALQIVQNAFSLARVCEGGGSLTIIGTVLSETGSPIDDQICQKFIGMGNMQLVLDRELADNCVWPAINVFQSGTRNEEALLPSDVVLAAHHLRRTFSRKYPLEVMEDFTDQIAFFESNAEFFRRLKQ